MSTTDEIPSCTTEFLVEPVEDIGILANGYFGLGMNDDEANTL